MGCIQASAYTTGTILGTYSGVDALDQCNNFCGVCCIPQCDGICEYCMTWVGAPRAHGTYVVTGDVTITYTDPINQCDPWHGGPFIGNSGPPGADTTDFSHTYTINGTYTWDGGYSNYWTNNSDNRVYIDGSQGWDTLGVWIDSANGYGWPIIIGTIHTAGANSWYPGYGGMSWEPGCGSELDWGDFTVGSSFDYYPTTFDSETGQCVPDYDSPSPFPAGFTITGSTINIKFIPSTENQSVCENAGGIFFGTDYYWNSTPHAYQAVDSCLFQTYATSTLVAECPPPIQLGGNYLDVTQSEPYSSLPAYYIYLLNGGCCEGICTQPYIKSSSTLGYCYDANYCVGFSPVPTTLGCNDTIGQSGCVQGGVYSPSGVGIGVWHSGTSCANFDCNPCTTNTDCVYCETFFLAPRDYGYFTVTNAGNIIFNDTNDPNNDNGLNDTYDINGTYAFGFDTGTSQWYFHTTHINGIGFAIEKTGDHIGSAKLYILMGYYGGTMSSYTDLIWDSVGNNCLQISSPNCYPYEYSPFTLVNPLPCWPGQSCPSLIVNTPAPTVIWNLTGTDKTTCDNAGGFYNDINYSNPTTSVCLLYDRIAANGPCNPPAHIGGNYYTDSDPDPTLHPYSQTTNGACCGICYPPISIDINTGCPTPICPPNQ